MDHRYRHNKNTWDENLSLSTQDPIPQNSKCKQSKSLFMEASCGHVNGLMTVMDGEVSYQEVLGSDVDCSKMETLAKLNSKQNRNSVEHNMILMDHLYDASFSHWIRQEENANVIGYHLGRVMVDYPAEKISTGLRWLFVDWRMSNIVLVLKGMNLKFHDEIQVLLGLTDGWSTPHIIEFLDLLYFQNDHLEDGIRRKEVAFALLEILDIQLK